MKLSSSALFSLLVGAVVEIGSSSAEQSTQHGIQSITIVTSEDTTSSTPHDDALASIPDIPRVLKKTKGAVKEPKVPKGGKVPKSAKNLTTASPSSQMTSQMTSQPSDRCASQKGDLLAIKAGFKNGDAVLSDWDRDTEPCDGGWTGITCISGEVTKIELVGQSLTGTLSPSFGCLSSLTLLYFFINSLSGSIPTELGQLTSLTGIGFHNNNLSGTIPTELGNLIGLTSAGFHNNNLSGTMPSEICALRDDADPGGLLEDLRADYFSPAKVECDCCTTYF